MYWGFRTEGFLNQVPTLGFVHVMSAALFSQLLVSGWVRTLGAQTPACCADTVSSRGSCVCCLHHSDPLHLLSQLPCFSLIPAYLLWARFHSAKASWKSWMRAWGHRV